MGRFSWIADVTARVHVRARGGRRVRDEDATTDAEVRVMRSLALKVEKSWVLRAEAQGDIGSSKPDTTEGPG